MSELQQEVDVILRLCRSELDVLKLESENTTMKDAEIEKEAKVHLLDRLDCIVINTEEKIDLLKEYSVSRLNGKTMIRTDAPHTLLELYSKLVIELRCKTENE